MLKQLRTMSFNSEFTGSEIIKCSLNFLLNNDLTGQWQSRYCYRKEFCIVTLRFITGWGFWKIIK